MPQASSIARDDETKCDVIPAGLRAWWRVRMKTSHSKAVSTTFIPPVFTAARQLQIYTGFPFHLKETGNRMLQLETYGCPDSYAGLNLDIPCTVLTIPAKFFTTQDA
ncbi:hypothetical protein D3C87_1645730 [compost metagenome]